MGKMARLLRKMKEIVLRMGLEAYFSTVSSIETARTKKYSNILSERMGNTDIVVIIALYEKTMLRSDVRRYLETLKKKGAYIIAANTCELSVEDVKLISGIVDVYIEKDNIGRDFGSYKECVLYFFDKGINNICKRLLICNDSVFYCTDGIDAFVDEMIKSKKNVLGSTENHDFFRHLGSFFLIISSNIFNNKAFLAFWKNYKKTNVRPHIIKKGELALSAMLFSASHGDIDFSSLYNASKIDVWADSKDKILDLPSLIRNGEVTSGSFVNLQENFCKNLIIDSYYRLYLKEGISSPEIKTSKELMKQEIDERVGYLTFIQWIDFLKSDVTSIPDTLLAAIKSVCLEIFTQGSQIHLNAVIFKMMGMPIIKLDLLYRSALSFCDILLLTDMIQNAKERAELKKILFCRLSGDKFHFGFRKAAFKLGYI